MSIFDYGYSEVGGKSSLSNSMIQTYLSCSVQGNLLYGENPLKPPLHLNAATAGVIVHKVLETSLEAPARWFEEAFQLVQEPLNITETQFIEHANWVEMEVLSKPWTVSPSFNKPHIQKKVEQTSKSKVLDAFSPADFLDAVLVPLVKGRTMRLYEKYGSCQREYSFHWSNASLPWALTGTADLFYYEPGKALFIGDYKTGNENWSVKKVENSNQFNHYAYLLRHILKEPELPVHVTVLALRRKEEVTAVLTLKHQERYKRFLEDALEIVQLTQTHEMKTLPSSGTMSCPCVVAKMGQCPYKKDL